MKTILDQNRIGFLLSIWEGLIKYDALKQKTDSSKCSEQILLRLLNIIGEDEFEDLNKSGSCGGIGKINFPAVDIGVINKYGYSITSECSNIKIEKSLQMFQGHNLINHFPAGMKMFILTGMKNLKPNKRISVYSFFNPDTDILSFRDLQSQLETLSISNPQKFSSAIDYLVNEFISVLPTAFLINNISVEKEDGFDKFWHSIETFTFSTNSFYQAKGIELVNQLLLLTYSSPTETQHENFIKRILPIFSDFADYVDENKNNLSDKKVKSIRNYYDNIKPCLDKYLSKVELSEYFRLRNPHKTFIADVMRIHRYFYPSIPFM